MIYNTLDIIKQKSFLPSNEGVTQYFARTDDEETFESSLKTQPEDWKYRTKEVVYDLNSLNYRTKEFDHINWSESVVVLGCSNVFGVGLSSDETIDYELSRLLNRPVINMGACGTSMMFSWYNSLILERNYPTPAAVVQIWSSTYRCVHFTPDKIFNYGSWNLEEPFNREWNRESCHPESTSLILQMSSQQMWKNKTKYYEASFFGHTADLLGCELLRPEDKSRDLLHPGHQTSKTVANIIAENLKL